VGRVAVHYEFSERIGEVVADIVVVYFDFA
jgi:hypothetical protein